MAPDWKVWPAWRMYSLCNLYPSAQKNGIGNVKKVLVVKKSVQCPAFWYKYSFVTLYLTIRLRAQNFYEVIVNEGEAWVNYRFIELDFCFCYFLKIIYNIYIYIYLEKTRNKHCEKLVLVTLLTATQYLLKNKYWVP